MVGELTAESLSKFPDRAERRMYIEDAYADRLANALPKIEEIVFDSPDQKEGEFAEKVKAVSRESSLSGKQEGIISEVFKRYQRDRQEVMAYRDLVMGKEEDRSASPFADIESCPEAKRTFLSDVGVRDLSAESVARFHLEESCPACFVVRFDGTSRALGKALFSGGHPAAAGFYTQRFISRGKRELSPKEQRRLELLGGECIFVTNPPPEERQQFEPRAREEVMAHEVRHYLFSLYWREGSHHDKPTFIDAFSRDELQAQLRSRRWRFEIDELLQLPFPNSYGGGEIYLRDFPDVTEDLINCLYEVERLSGRAYKNETLVANIVLTSESLAQAARRLSRLGEKEENPVANYARLFLHVNESKLDVGNPNRGADNNLVFLKALADGALGAKIESPAARQEALREFTSAFARALGPNISGGFGAEKEDSPIGFSTTISFINEVKQLFLGNGVTDLEPLDEPLGRAEDNLQAYRRNRDWPVFITHLAKIRPDLSEKYKSLSSVRTHGGRFRLREFRRNELEELFEDWQSKHRGKSA